MRAVPVVVMRPEVEGGGAFGRALVGEAVGPLSERRLDEPLGLAVGLRAVRPGVAFGDAELAAGLYEGSGAERRTVVGEQPPDRDAQGCVVGRGGMQEGDGAVLLLVGGHGREADPGMVVDSHEQELPARAARAIGSVT